MATKPGPLSRMASQTMATGREHVAKVLTGEETVPEAAGAAVEELLSGSASRSKSKPATRKAALTKVVKKKLAAKAGSVRKKAKSK
jgi:hypothetical protein